MTPAPELLEEIKQRFEQGKIGEGLQLARAGRDRYGVQDCYYWWRFSLYLEAGGAPDRTALLDWPLPLYLRGKRAEVKAWWARGDEDPGRKAEFLARARKVAEALNDGWAIAWTDLRIANVQLNANPRQYARAATILESVIDQADRIKDIELHSKALINLSVARMNLDRHDEAIALCEEAVALLPADAEDRGHAEVNLGWSWLQLGETDKALRHTLAAVDLFSKLRKTVKNGRALRRILSGYVTGLRNLAKCYVRDNQMNKATESLRQALEANTDLDAETRAGIWADQAEAALIEGHLDRATQAVNEAVRISGYTGAIESQSDAHILFLKARIQEIQGDMAAAIAGYRNVFRSNEARGEMRLEAAGLRAGLLGREHSTEARDQYRDAAGLLEAMRKRLTADESKLSFFQASSTFFDQYVDLLVRAGQHREALAVADGSRARLLSDYQEDPQAKQLDLAALQMRLRSVDGVALFYWIGGAHSYLWIVDGVTVEFVDLQDSAAIQTRAVDYARAVATKPVLTEGDRQIGCELRQRILGPAHRFLTPDRRVFMVTDGALGLINPESLPDCQDGSSWLIRDVNVSLAPSLAFLCRPPPAGKASRTLLAIGDAEATPEFPKLENAALELDTVTGLFPQQFDSFRGKNARPAAYLDAHPERYDMIHFTAHGEAKASNPLDSAVILSPEPNSRAFKLYARDIAMRTITARLVTISACKSASSRTYRGEGVVGLAWAFLRVGAGQVVAGLWNVNDESARHLMTRFYSGIREGLPPANALRAAKLYIMKGYKGPHDWAVFEMFSGYIEPQTGAN